MGAYDTSGGTPRHDPMLDHEPEPHRVRIVAAVPHPGESTHTIVEIGPEDWDFEVVRGSGRDALDETRRRHGEEARKLESALHDALAGGTYDALFALMADRRRSHFIVPHAEPRALVPKKMKPIEQSFVDLVFDTSQHGESPLFVEAENQDRASVRIGEWVERDDGYSALRIPDPRDVATLRGLLRDAAINCGPEGRDMPEHEIPRFVDRTVDGLRVLRDQLQSIIDAIARSLGVTGRPASELPDLVEEGFRHTSGGPSDA